MTEPPPQEFCPYKGLQPYTEADRIFFFGRERDSEIIASNLYAAPLTVLYGESGVGKSSVLLAGVVPLLRQTPNVAVVVFRQWQDARFASMLKMEILRAVKETTGKEAAVDLSLPLDEFIVACNRLSRGPVFFIFDQFEEFFLSHAASTQDAESFDAEWARAVNRQDVDANFLLSLREEGLSRLDRFRGRIPKLLGNMLRLKHLDREAGREAIRKPLEKYNELLSPALAPMQVEDAFVETLLDEVKAGRVTLGAAKGQVSTQTGDGGEREDDRIETPFLQMVLIRLWNEERGMGSQTLRVNTLNELGGAERIIRTHLDKVMEKLSDAERDAAARLFRYLVTPSGSKIAHTAADLVSYAELPHEQVEPVLETLSAPDVRIFRPIAPPPDAPEQFRYEIFHDVLAASVLDWRRRYTEQQAQEKIRREEQQRLEAEQQEIEHARQLKRTRVLRLGILGLSILLLITGVSLSVALFQSLALRRALKDAQANEIAANASALLNVDPELSLLLAIEAVQLRPTAEAVHALKSALMETHLRLILRGHGVQANGSVHDEQVRGVAYSPDGKRIVTAGWDNTVRVWNAQTGQSIQVLRGHTGHVMGVEYSPDGKYIASASIDKSVRIWSADDWRDVGHLAGQPLRAGAYHVGFNRDTRYIVIAADTRVMVWNWTSTGFGNPVMLSMPKGSHTYYAEFSPDGRYIVTASKDGIARIWQWQTEAGRKEPVQMLRGHTGAVRSASFSPDGALLVTASEGGILQSGSDSTDAGNDNSNQTPEVKVEDKKTTKPVEVDEDWSARIWRISNGEEINEFRGHTGPVYNAAFSPDMRYVVTASRDNSAQVWEINSTSSDKPLVNFRGHTEWVFDAAFSPDSLFVVTASEDGTARIWKVTNDPNEVETSIENLLALAQKRKARDLTTIERQRYLHQK